MKTLKICLPAIACLLLYSCKKESTEHPNIALLKTVQTTATAAKMGWQGTFLSYNGLPPSFPVGEKDFINNGYARIFRNSFKKSRQNYYSTKIWLTIPSNIRIKGDSLNFEVGVKNPFNSAFYPASEGRDITLYIKGETNEAAITNVATADVNPGSGERAAVQLGQRMVNQVPALQYNFEDWGTFILQTFNRGVVAYRNNEYVAGLYYGDEPLVGRLKEIGVVFKGSGYIDYIKLSRSSTNGTPLMSEDFNEDGQSTIIWY